MSTLPSDVPQTSPQPGGLVAFVRRHPLFFYFFHLSLGLAGLGAPGSFSDGTPALSLPWPTRSKSWHIGGISRPHRLGLSLHRTNIGKAGLRQFLRRFILWRVGFQWYVFAVLACPILIMLGIFATVPNALSAFIPSMLPSVLLLFVGLLIAEMFVSGLIEEPGWRGFALPRLQERYGPLTGSLILGFFWGLWHLPVFTIQGYDGAGPGFLGIIIPWTEFTVALMAMSIIMTWVFNHTKGSILIAMITHASIDAFPRPLLFPASYLSALASPLILVAWPVLAIILLIVTQGKLGYGDVATPGSQSLLSDSEILDKAGAGTFDKKEL